MTIQAGDTQLLLEAAFTAAKGDSRTALALLHGAFVELSIRIAIDEQPTARHVAASHAFLHLGAAALTRAARQWEHARDGASAGGDGAGPDVALGRLHDAQGQGAHHASALRSQVETRPLTRSSSGRGYEYDLDADADAGDTDDDELSYPAPVR